MEGSKYPHIGEYLEYTILPKENSSLSEVQKQETVWNKNPNRTISFSKETRPVWFKLHLTYNGTAPHTFYLIFSSPVVDLFELYYFHSDKWIRMTSGEQVLQKDKPIFSHLPAFPITLSSGETITVFVKIESANPIFNFVSIYDTYSFLTYSKKNDIFFAAYFGAGGLMFIYSLFLAYSLRYKQFYFYFFYLSSILLINLFSTGFMQYVEIGDSHTWKNYFFPISIYASCIFGLLFTSEFLNIQKKSPKLHKLIQLLICISFLMIFSILFISLRSYIHIAVFVVMIPILLGLFISFYFLLQNRKKVENYLFFFALGSVLLGASINTLTIQGLVQPTPFALYSLLLGSALEIFLIAMALMVRVRQLRKDTENKREIDIQLQVARQLQKDLLPKKLGSIKGYPLGFSYIPTSEIGGDFVQIIEKEDCFGLFLCDVSGHGIPAAIIASMTKVSLQLWADQLDEPALAAQKIRLSLLESLSGNFLTAVFIYIHPEKKILKFANAGHHPLILLQSNGECEYIHSQGRAITEYIPLEIKEETIPLPETGTLILYTDGILEARNPSTGILFGEEGLISVLQKMKESDPQKICDHVTSEVSRFQKHKRAEDDITILALNLSKR
ncbi:SpoIIE family protein phosphatase [Leptospira sp. 'Mane']|uniref:SpoIIE family protein phosphatase n=1 Tax=Leptospira sp. 'Mane' TaxID=3387407 RepID=UPI00398B78E1